jgi:hypothetical protein
VRLQRWLCRSGPDSGPGGRFNVRFGKAAAAASVAALAVGLAPAATASASTSYTVVSRIKTVIAIGAGTACLTSNHGTNGVIAAPWQPCGALLNYPAPNYWAAWKRVPVVVADDFRWTLTTYSDGKVQLQAPDGTCLTPQPKTGFLYLSSCSSSSTRWGINYVTASVINLLANIALPGVPATTTTCLDEGSANEGQFDYCDTGGDPSIYLELGPQAYMDYQGTCPAVSTTATGELVRFRTGSSMTDCSWVLGPQTGSTYWLQDSNGMCLDSSYAGVTAGTPLVQGLCGNSSGGTTWWVSAGTLPNSVRYEQVLSQLCAVPKDGGLSLGSCDWRADFTSNLTGPLKNVASAKCVVPQTFRTQGGVLLADMGLGTDCSSGSSTYRMDRSTSGVQLHNDPANPNGSLCLGVNGTVATGAEIVRGPCSAAGTTWTPVAGSQTGTREFQVGGLCLTTDLGLSNLSLGRCNSYYADFS